MEGSCSTGQSPQWAVVPVEEEEEEKEEEEEEEDEEEKKKKKKKKNRSLSSSLCSFLHSPVNSSLFMHVV
jgi:hypothetical protein